MFIHNFANKITGQFSKEEFEEACRKYLSANKKYIREFKEMNECSNDEAIAWQVQQYIEQYYDK